MKLATSLAEFYENYPDWRGERLQQLRKVISANPKLTEEIKWGVPVWTNNGPVCAISAFKDHVKINFFKGAFLSDQKLFNNGMDSKEHRSIDLAENDPIDEQALTLLVAEAVDYNAK